MAIHPLESFSISITGQRTDRHCCTYSNGVAKKTSLFHSHWHTQVTLPPAQSVSPRVHLQPGLQLSGFRSIHSCQDVPTVYVDDLHRQVTHLTCLIQRLQRGRRTVIFWIGIVLMGLGLNGLPHLSV